MVIIATHFDLVCPWCYIGKARMDRALCKRHRGRFTLRWQPFLLNPDMPTDGVDRQAYLRWKFGGEAGAAKITRTLKDVAESEHLEFRPDRISRTPNTIDAHRILHWATLEGLDGSKVIDLLFAAYFCGGLDIGQVPVLAEIAEQGGMDSALVRKLLGGDTDREHVTALYQRARRMGIGSVPYSIVDGTHVVQGAQPTSIWADLFDSLEEVVRSDGESPVTE